jgi:peptide methionine sulfoxide reductase MsrA
MRNKDVHTHRFVEHYRGLVGFGLDRKTDEHTVMVYLQKLSDDLLMEKMIQRMSEEDLEALFLTMTRMLKKYLSEDEYHELFLKDEP